jgi:hypothetical protein
MSTASQLVELEQRRCKRPYSHLPHIWVDDVDATTCIDYRCPGPIVQRAVDWSKNAPRPDRRPIASMLPVSAYADAERVAGLAQASRMIVAGQPRHALLTLIRTVESQARIEGISGFVLPYRLDAVTR